MASRNAFKVFVGNLPWTIGSTELRQFASSFGHVMNSQVIFDRKTGLSKGYGFITFGNRDGYNAVLKSGNGVYFLEGHHINVSATNASTNPGGSDDALN
jgi:RNA recognition motif-containing protein